MVLGERDLLERFRAGDEEALETVYLACVARVTRIADAVLRTRNTNRAGGKGEVAIGLADVVQEVFVKVFAPNARARFDSSRPFDPYIAQITRNVAIDHYRQMIRYVPCDTNDLIDEIPPELDMDTAVDDRSEAATLALVNRYLASLDDETLRVHEAIYVKGMSQRDAAQMLGLGRQVVRTVEARLRTGLRRELARAARRGLLAHPSAANRPRG
jgi:RNA polymerase sigma factor (sigma-70 family)